VEADDNPLGKYSYGLTVKYAGSVSMKLRVHAISSLWFWHLVEAAMIKHAELISAFREMLETIC
jgi:hypothetical protein